MFLLHLQSTVPAAIALHTPRYLQWLSALGAGVQRFADARRRAAQARTSQAALLQLDARTLRDVGLGDFAASAIDADDASFRRELDLRGF